MYVPNNAVCVFTTTDIKTWTQCNNKAKQKNVKTLANVNKIATQKASLDVKINNWYINNKI